MHESCVLCNKAVDFIRPRPQHARMKIPAHFQKHKKLSLALIGVIGALLALMLLAAPVCAGLLKWTLQAKGVPISELRISQLGTSHIQIAKVEFTLADGVRATLEDVSVDYSLTEALATRVQHVPVEPEATEAVTTLTTETSENSDTLLTALSQMPISHVTVKALRVTAEKDGKVTEIALPIEITREGDVLKAISRAPYSSEKASLTADLTASWFYKEGHAAAEIRVSQVAIAQETFPLSLRDGVMTLDGFLQPNPVVTITYALNQLEHTATLPAFAALNISGNAVLHEKRVEGNADITFAHHEAKLNAQYEYALADHKGHVEVKSDPIQFKPGVLQPDELVPTLAASLQQIEGGIGLDVQLGIDKGALTQQDLMISVQGLSGTIAGMMVQDVMGTVVFDKLQPLHTPENQELVVGLLHMGLPLSNGIINFSLDDRTLKLGESTWQCAGGELKLDAVTLNLDKPEIDNMVLRVEQAQLADIMNVLAKGQVNAEGLVDGTIPLSYKDGVLSFHAGELKARAPGVLQYKPDEGTAGILSGQSQTELLRDALADFHFDVLDMTLDTENAKDMHLTMKIAGKNPAVLSGKPIELNVDLRGNIADIVQAGMASYRLEKELQHKLEMEEKKKQKR